MNRKLSRVLLALAAGVVGLAMVASAAGAPAGAAKAIRAHGDVVALALAGNRVAFGNGPAVVVWNLRTGKTIKEGTGTDGTYTGGWIDRLAIVGSRVAYLIRSGGNLEEDDYLYTFSLLRPRPRLVATEVRSGAQCGAGRGGYHPACAGTWLGGVVGSGNRILVNRWTTDTTGAISGAGLYTLNGTRFKSVATGPETVEAVAADSAHVAVLQWRWNPPGTTIHVYSSNGKRLSSVTPNGYPLQVAISGRNLVVLERNGKLALYNASTGSLQRTFNLHAKELPKVERTSGNPKGLQALAVQGNIAVYSTPARFSTNTSGVMTISASAIHALNLANGRDRPLGRLAGQITLARIDSAGLAYANSGNGWGPDRVVFVPLKQVATAVS